MARKSLTEKVSRDISIEWGMVHAIMWGKNHRLSKQPMGRFQVSAQLLCSVNSKRPVDRAGVRGRIYRTKKHLLM